ncbi:hypothetical protein KZZ52_23975 [Dactylosporangium sp. AC04546]|uniref:hypothetical protein n=1 Tax=Dactylosporangium sp. AC04546 TaxID=2862460 RepID=UPI001EDDFDBF|nr:hypothetical protein [Dactylosporangium sp. AC04546]WVK88334.1 hypothetical protein KZZ52_23975 [Dactylosporangium sp. AC04546]
MTESRPRSALSSLLRRAAASPLPNVIAPDPARPLWLVVADAYVVGLICGGTECVRGLAHDLQALLVAAGTATDPATVPATPELLGQPRAPMRAPVAEVAAVCDAAVSGAATVPYSWIDAHARLVLGPGPGPGEQAVFDHDEWRVVRAMLLGGFTAVAAERAWPAAAKVLRTRGVVVAGAEHCPVLAPGPGARPVLAPKPEARPRTVLAPQPEARPAATSPVSSPVSSPTAGWPKRVPGASLAGIAELRDQPGEDGHEALAGELAELRRKAASTAAGTPLGAPAVVGNDILRRIIDRLKNL